MKKAARALALLFCLAALSAFAAYRLWEGTVSLLGARLAGGGQLAAITALPEEDAGGCVLHWNGEPLPYDSARGAYCLPQPLEGEALGRLTASWGQVYLPEGQWAGDRSRAMESGERLEVYVSDGRRFCRLSVYLSGLPVLAIHTESSVPYKLDPAEVGQTMSSLDLSYNYGQATLFWPAGNSRSRLTSSAVEWHWRGNASLFARKKSYRVNLLDEKGRGNELDLLGLGEENGWVLVNFSTDCTRTRDKVASDLWNELAAACEHDPAGAEMEYVELYLDDTYLGVYGLCRSINRKSMELSRQDVMYKWRQAAMIDDEEFDRLESEQSTEWFNWLEVVWPNVWEQGVWEPLRGYVNALYRDGNTDWESIESMVNIDNLIDMALYKQFTCALDNLLQNQYFLYRDGEELLYRIPWDMNYSFGDNVGSTLSMDLETLVIRDLELEALYTADPERTRQLVAERWAELRQTVFSTEHLVEMFRDATAQLTDSGAWVRDYGLWGEIEAYRGLSEHVSLPLEETLEFMEARLAFLDEYMADFVPGGQEVFNVVS